MRRGLFPSRQLAQDAIATGKIRVAGSVADKPARLVAPGEPIVVEGPPPPFVSRGGLKLEAALNRFAIDVTDRLALDAGASTGGFTDCLLQRGARKVVAVDVGRAQLHETLRADPRVTSVEGINIRTATLDDVGRERFDVVVADLSFISLRSVAPNLLGLARQGADVVVLVKPQFEAGRAEASRGRGVVRDPDVWRRVLIEVTSAMVASGAAMMGCMPSPIKGADGNVEFLVHAVAGADGGPDLPGLDQAVAEAAG